MYDFVIDYTAVLDHVLYSWENIFDSALVGTAACPITKAVVLVKNCAPLPCAYFEDLFCYSLNINTGGTPANCMYNTDEIRVVPRAGAAGANGEFDVVLRRDAVVAGYSDTIMIFQISIEFGVAAAGGSLISPDFEIA